MANQPVTREKLISADIDVDNLGKASNELGVVNPRYGDPYKTAPQAIKDIEDNGAAAVAEIMKAGGYFKSYATLAAANADIANIPMNRLVRVLEAVNGGDYYKDSSGATTLTKSAYDPLTQAKNYTDQKYSVLKQEILINDKTQDLTATAFSVANQIWNISGSSMSGWSGYYRTTKIAAKKGDVIKVRTRMNDTYPILLVWESDQVTLIHAQNISQITADTDGEKTYVYTMPVDGYFATQKSPTSVNTSLTINAGLSYFVAPDKLSTQPPILELKEKKADKTRTDTLSAASYTLYNWTSQGVLSTTLEPKTVLGTAHLRLTKGMTVTISRSASGYFYAIRSSSSEDVTVTSDQWQNDAGRTYTVLQDVEYVRVFLRKSANTEITTDQVENITQNIFKVTVSDEVAYSKDWRLSLDDTNKRISNLGLAGHTSNFRAPSLADGGVVTIIDDDGRSSVHSLLYPMLKALDVPFGAAIVPSQIDTNPVYMTKTQLKELEADDKYVEIMNHTWSHQNLSTLTNSQIHKEVYRTKRWFIENGFDDDALVLPFGGDNADVQRVVQQYYSACYDFGVGTGLHTFDTMQNFLIRRSNFGVASDRLESHKALVDQCAANNGWFVITTHVLLNGYWNETSQAELTELINYIKSKGCKFMKPRDAFQVFGNIVENDSGFKITANGKIIGAS